MTLNYPFDQLITDPEIQALRSQGSRPGRIHPLVSVALHPGAGQQPGTIERNTCRALERVLLEFPQWPINLRSRLLDSSDWANSESALAEIRACGALLEGGFTVVLGGTNAATGARPEFHVEIGGKVTIVEVWNRNLSKQAITGIRNQHAATKQSQVVGNNRVTSSGAVVTPFGAPNPAKEGDSVLTNVISKIAGIKEQEHQAHDDRPFVVWVDLQNMETMRFDFSDHLQPIMNYDGVVESGGYWHALYGRKGDILMEASGGYTRANRMLHEGRYSQLMKHGARTRISGFAFCSPNKTAFMENPAAANPVAPEFRKQLIELPLFDIGLSLVNWSEHLVENTVGIQREYIASVAATVLGLHKNNRSSLLVRGLTRLGKLLVKRGLRITEMARRRGSN